MFRPVALSVVWFLPAMCLLNAGLPLSVAQNAIIIDHTCTDLTQIPPEWLEQAKALTLHYAHTSHGSQLMSGIDVLEDQNPLYSYAVRESGSEGLPPAETPPALRIYDGNPPETYIEPDDYWATSAGLDRTRAVAATGRYDFSMWSWCGQQSWNPEEVTQAYCEALDQLEAQFPNMRFIYMTGHTDGSGLSGTLNQRNEQVRQYCRDHGKVLFDFADIESYDPDGNYFLNRNCNDNCDYDGGNWAVEWCAAHPGSPLCQSCGCAHSQPLNCNLKGHAFWWMMARLAGWQAETTPQIGDLNCDGRVNTFDIDPFVLALTSTPDFSGYYAVWPNCDPTLADCNHDGAVNTFDIDPFVLVLTSTAR